MVRKTRPEVKRILFVLESTFVYIKAGLNAPPPSLPAQRAVWSCAKAGKSQSTDDELDMLDRAGAAEDGARP